MICNELLVLMIRGGTLGPDEGLVGLDGCQHGHIVTMSDGLCDDNVDDGDRLCA